MEKKLLIVESPGKIKKLKEFLGNDWEVKASMGHISDLPGKTLGIDKANDFRPLYEVSKKEVVSGLRAAVQQIGKENVYLATDEDREGEAISYHLCKNLGLDYKSAKRVTFGEITKVVVQTAVNNPRKLNIQLVAAQEARRVIDRLVGYEISPLLWRKIESDTNLSAGRVQSVALKLIVEREKSILDFTPKSSFRITGQFITESGSILKATALHNLDSNPEQIRIYLKMTSEKNFSVTNVSKSPEARNPQPPFSTSTLQQDANKKLKLSVAQTMEIAQKLYEGGHITYMRTDSVNLSDVAIDNLAGFIEKSYGQEYVEKRKFKNKNESAQEAHEAIRPTHFENDTIDGSDDEKALYKLIYLRAVASQMKAKQTLVTTISISSEDGIDEFQAKAKQILFDGYTKAYADVKDDENGEEEETEIRESVNPGDRLKAGVLTAATSLSKPKSRYGEAELVKELETLGIGRPSTYAPTIRTIKDVRKYVSLGKVPGKSYETLTVAIENGKLTEQKGKVTIGQATGKLIPNPIAYKLVEFLDSEFAVVMDYKFTAKCESNFDEIADGKLRYASVVSSFYTELEKLLKQAEGKYDDVVKRERKTSDIGSYKEKLVSIGKGEKGLYLLYNKEFYPIKDVVNVEEIDLEKAIQIIEGKKIDDKKRKDDLESKTMKVLGKYKIIVGNFGPYITDGKDNAPVPKWEIDNIDQFDLAKCKDIIKAYKAYKKKKK